MSSTLNKLTSLQRRRAHITKQLVISTVRHLRVEAETPEVFMNMMYKIERNETLVFARWKENMNRK